MDLEAVYGSVVIKYKSVFGFGSWMKWVFDVIIQSLQQV